MMKDDGWAFMPSRSWPNALARCSRTGGRRYASFEILDVFCRADHIIVIDSMNAGGEPGTIYRAPLEELGLKDSPAVTSLHELHFTEAIKVVNLMGYHPQVTVFGVEPCQVELGLGLTPVITEKMPRLLKLVEAEIRHILSASE